MILRDQQQVQALPKDCQALLYLPQAKRRILAWTFSIVTEDFAKEGNIKKENFIKHQICSILTHLNHFTTSTRTQLSTKHIFFLLATFNIDIVENLCQLFDRGHMIQGFCAVRHCGMAIEMLFNSMNCMADSKVINPGRILIAPSQNPACNGGACLHLVYSKFETIASSMVLSLIKRCYFKLLQGQIKILYQIPISK